MNGENIKILVQDSLYEPTSLAIDYFMSNRIYWSDSKHNIIESINPDGTDRKKLSHSLLKNPLKIDIFENYLYWISRESGTLNKIDKFGRGSAVKIIGSETLIDEIKIYHPLKMEINKENPCFSSNCSHLCLLKPNFDYECVCPDNTEIIDQDISICNAPIEDKIDNPLECLCYNCWCWYNDVGVHTKCLTGNKNIINKKY
jgi:low density lipoprotein-related protein 2